MEELSRASASIGLVLRRAFEPVRQPDPPQRHDAQKKRHLPKLVSGEHVGALAMSEPAPARTSSRCDCGRKRGDRYVLNGNKMWITNGPTPDAGGLRQDRPSRPRGITAFLIEKGMKGFSTAQKLDKLGMRGSNTCELVFRDCEVPARTCSARTAGRRRC
jgi:isovaleryl-CoA dehydrogenase